jgi:hypothetical protein
MRLTPSARRNSLAKARQKLKEMTRAGTPFDAALARVAHGYSLTDEDRETLKQERSDANDTGSPD